MLELNKKLISEINKKKYKELSKYFHINDYNDGYNIDVDNPYNLYCFRFDWLAIKLIIQENEQEISYYIENVNTSGRSDVVPLKTDDLEDIIHNLILFNEENNRLKRLFSNCIGLG